MVKKLNRIQIKKLINRRELRPADRANMDYKMAKKLQAGLDDLAGLLYIMKNVPPRKIMPSEERKYGLKDRHVCLLLELTEAALRILDYKKVRGTPDDLYILEERNKKVIGVNGKTGEATKQGEFHRATARKKDIERAISLHDHVDYLIQKFVPEINIKHPGSGQSYGIEDLIEMQMMKKEEQKIKELLASGMKDNCSFNLVKIEQIAKEADRDPLEVLQIAYQIQETKREIERSTERRKQDILNLESDSAAIQTIKELWAKGYFNYTAIAVAIGHGRGAVVDVIEKMRAKGDIPKDDHILVQGDGFPKPPEIDLRKHEENLRILQPFMSRRDETK